MSLRVSGSPHLLNKESTQTLMLDVLIALAPTTAAGIYLFGTRAALVLGIAVISAIISEYLWRKLAKKTNTVSDLSCIVTGLILGLNLPASVPLWMPLVGSVVAIVLVKQLFGGLGHNFINPAMLARAVLLASWPARMTHYTLPVRVLGSTSVLPSVDAVSSATPLLMSGKWGLYDLLLGNVPGTIGEVCKLAILVGFLYMLFVGTIKWEVPVLFIGTTALLTWALGGNPLVAILSGGVLFGAVFMATDYVTNPMYSLGRCIFAVGCGIVVVAVRKYGNYPEGVTFAILFMNCLTPLIDRFSTRKVYGMVKNNA